jgi:sugar/nucleoside kinase (ribokinase family)
LPPKCSTGDDVNNYLKNAGVKSIAITKGAAPIRFASGLIEGTMQVPQVQVVDTTGAGDVFHGAFCYFAASGSGFVEALAESAKVAAESCRYRGTTEWAKALTGNGG